MPSEKVLLGLGFYGRSFTLTDPNCNTPGCKFKKINGTESGGAKPGRCTKNSGTLSDYEIDRIIKKESSKVSRDDAAGVNWISWGKDQWYVYPSKFIYWPAN